MRGAAPNLFRKDKIPFLYQATAEVSSTVDVALPAVKDHLKSQQGEDKILLKWFNGRTQWKDVQQYILLQLRTPVERLVGGAISD
jgi:hypothetical protein